MTGYLSPGSMQLSRISIASLKDMGYKVKLWKADPYTVDDLRNCGSYCPNQRRRAIAEYDDSNDKVTKEGHEDVLKAAAAELHRQRMEGPTNLPHGMEYVAAETVTIFIRDYDGKIKGESVSYEEVKDLMPKDNIFEHST